MKVSIRNVLGVERADFHIHGISLLAGRNGAGKSSVCAAVAGALARNTLLKPGVLKSQGARLVRDGADEGAVTVKGEGGILSLSYPSGVLHTEGAEPPAASDYATGLRSVADLPPKDASRALSSILNADPGRPDLVRAILDAGLSESHADRLWSAIEEQGWDATHATLKEHGASLKGRWEAATGDNYGVRKAECWAPEGWAADDLAGMNPDDLQAAFDRAKEDFERALRVTAVEESERARLEALAAETGAREKAMEAAEKAVEEAEAARAALTPLPPEEDTPDATCPHCGAAVQVQPAGRGAWALTEPGKSLSATDRRKLEDAHRQAAGKIDAARHQAFQARKELEEAREAAAKLDGLPEASESAPPMEDARQAMDAAQAALVAHQTYTEAAKCRASIAGNALIVSILSPDGLRKAVTSRAVEAFNDMVLDPLCRAAKRGAVRVQPDLSLVYGTRDYRMLCESERYFLRAVLAIAVAKTDGSAAVVLDGADILDSAGRNGLIAMLRAAGIPALVGMTVNRPDLVPDLGAKKAGHSYWVQSGVVAPLADAVAATKEQAA